MHILEKRHAHLSKKAFHLVFLAFRLVDQNTKQPANQRIRDQHDVRTGRIGTGFCNSSTPLCRLLSCAFVFIPLPGLENACPMLALKKLTASALVISLALYTSLALGQGHAFELGAYTGQMLNIHSAQPSTGMHKALVLSWTHRSYSYWYKAWHEPETGIAISYHDFGNSDVLGEGIGLQYQLGLKNRFKTHWRYFGRVKMGALYHTTKYHPTENPTNTVNGSDFSFLMTLSGGLEFKPSVRSRILMEGSLWHTSNGHTALPNVGANIAMLSVSYRCYLRDEGYLNVPKPVDSNQVRPWKPMARIAFGINEGGAAAEQGDGQSHDKYLLAFGFQNRYKPAFRLMVSMEAYYDKASRLFADSEGLSTESKEFLRSSAVLLMLGHEFIYNHFGVIFQGGVNVYNPTLGDHLKTHDANSSAQGLKRHVPGRFAVRYYFLNLWKHMQSPFLQMGVKSNFVKADFLEFGAGFTL